MAKRITVELCEDLHIVREIMCNPKLFEASMPDEERDQLKAGIWETNHKDKWQFLLVKCGDGDIGIVRFAPLTLVTVEVHFHILPHLWGTRISDAVGVPVTGWLLENTKYHKITINTPLSCKHVIALLDRQGFDVEGLLRGATLWDSKIQDLVVMSKFIRSI